MNPNNTSRYTLASAKVILSDRQKYAPPHAFYRVYHNGQSVWEIYRPKGKTIDKSKVFTTLFVDGCKFVKICGEDENKLSVYLTQINDNNVHTNHKLSAETIKKMVSEIMEKHSTANIKPRNKKVFFGQDANKIIESKLKSELADCDAKTIAKRIIKEKQRIAAIECGKLKRGKTLAKLYSYYDKNCTQTMLVARSGEKIWTVKRYWSEIKNYKPTVESIAEYIDVDLIISDEQLFIESVAKQLAEEATYIWCCDIPEE